MSMSHEVLSLAGGNQEHVPSCRTITLTLYKSIVLSAWEGSVSRLTSMKYPFNYKLIFLDPCIHCYRWQSQVSRLYPREVKSLRFHYSCLDARSRIHLSNWSSKSLTTPWIDQARIYLKSQLAKQITAHHLLMRQWCRNLNQVTSCCQLLDAHRDCMKRHRHLHTPSICLNKVKKLETILLKCSG